MSPDQPDLFFDYLPRAPHLVGEDGQSAFENYCYANGINPRVDCDETRAARHLIRRIRGG
jgi:hypothetical protein